jgi:hypothetical protein
VTELVIGATYRTRVATWTLEAITPDGIVYAVREDGKKARLSLNYLKEQIIERIPDPIQLS